MHVSDEGLSLIKKFEGCRLTAYRCPAGVLTIGYGHTAGVTEGMQITVAQADDYLREDINKFELAVLKYDPVYHFTQNQFDALVSFTYNCGVGNLKNLTSSGTRTISQISAKFPAYCKAGGVVLLGLQRRRAAEKALFDDAQSDTVMYYPRYTGDSVQIDIVFASIGADADYNTTQTKAYLRRKPIAAANGIEKYTGTAAQNNKLIAAAKSGTLRRA